MSAYQIAKQRYGARHISEAPKDGKWIVGYANDSLRKMRIYWNGQCWKDESGDSWASVGIAGWTHETQS